MVTLADRFLAAAGKPAKVTAAIITMLPGEATGWHQHDVPMFDYILEGEVTVDYGAQGTRVYRTGEAVMEAIAVAHNGRNTGSGPARILGLTNKGHLGVGADADVTVYTPDADRKAMFELPRFVVKAGEVVVEQGELRRTPFGPALVTRPEYDPGVLPHVRAWFEGEYTLAFENYAVGDEYTTHGEVVVEGSRD